MMSIDWVSRNAHLINFDVDRSNEPDTEPESDTEPECDDSGCEESDSDDDMECEYCEIYGLESQCGTCLQRYCRNCCSNESKMRSIETGILICGSCCDKEDDKDKE